MTPDAAAVYATARTLTDERRYRDAEDALGEAARAARAEADDDLLARIEGTLAYVLDQRGRPDEGERLCRETLERSGLSPHTRGVVEGQLGSILSHRGRLDDAAHWLGRAIETIPDDPHAVAVLRLNRSVVAMQRRDLTLAATDLEAAIVDFEAHGDRAAAAEARHNLGYTALLGGDLVRAMREMGDARPVIAAASAVNAAICDVDLAEALRDAGLVTDAERMLRDAARAFRAHDMPQARAEAELQLARSLLRHDPAEAATVATQAARHFAALGAGTWADRARGIRVRALLAGGTIDRAGRTVGPAGIDDHEVSSVAAALTRAGLRADAMAVRLTRELWRARRGSEPGPLPRVPRGAPLEVRILAHEVRAERAARAGDEARARRSAADGLDELTSWSSSFGSLDLQTSLAMHASSLVLSGLSSALRSARPELAFEWSERARHLSSQVVPLRPPADPEQAAELSELRMLRADAAGSGWTDHPRAIELGERLRRRQWTGTAVADLERPVDLATAASALDGDTAMLAYVFSGDGLSCIAVTATGAETVGLRSWTEVRSDLAALRSDLDMAAAVRTGPMVDVVRRSLRDRLERLSDALVERPLRDVDACRLVITAPGVLSGLPWGMLPGLQGRAVTVATSMSRWVHGRARATSPRRTAAFAVGPRVSRGLEETAAGAAAWGGAPVLHGADATVAAVASAAGTADVLHIAAHGHHSVDNPLFSGVQLADGALFGYDIDLMPTVPAAVVLSSCEAGRSAVRWGEEAIGMARAWLHAGSASVVAAPVVVADDDACEVLGSLHDGLARGLPPALALAAATRTTGIRSPFVCHGNGF
ncbi:MULTISPECIES: CHAT domain-containing protein [unclassified Microbacterium]|uniref:CHAT domain-containing protein n=1 Tax=unclassified Microbacterium TaxID=2609290 RepID=UPI00301871E4